jgi:tetratricopeptide (TPR) repeat protein
MRTTMRKSGRSRALRTEAYRGWGLMGASRRCSLGLAFLILVIPGAGIAIEPSGPNLAEGETLLAERKYREAAAFFERLSMTHGGDPEVQCLWGTALAGMEDFEAAILRMKRAIKLAAAPAPYHVAHAEVLFKWAGTGGKLQAMGRAKEARAECEKALALDPGNERARVNLFWFYLRAPGIAGGDRDKARTLMQELQGLSPGKVGYRLLETEFLLPDRKHAAAESLLHTTSASCRTREDSLAMGSVYNRLGYAYLGEKDCDRAVSCLKTYGAWVPQGANPHDSLGDAYAACGNPEGAMAEYETAASMEERFADISGKKLRELRKKTKTSSK